VNQDTVTQLAMQAITVAFKIAGPFLIAGLVVGLIVSIIQAATSIQEVTLSFIPKMIVTGAVIALAGPWMLNVLVGYTQALFLSIPSLVGP
jgi:flagellar biosynthesis protein FliQ